MPVTIKDIAKEAGVSHSTVSRALRASSLISEETTKHIQETAQKLGYLPSAAARSLKTNRSQALGVIVSNIDDPYFSEILQGIEEVAQGSKASALLALVGVVNLPIIKYSVDWWLTLHQPSTFKLTAAPSMPPEMYLPLLVSALGFYVFFAGVLLFSVGNEILSREQRTQWVTDLVRSRQP